MAQYYHQEVAMDFQTEWSCWEIVKCGKSNSCPAVQEEGKPCWEVARSLDDYRSAMNVCRDCFVYVVLHEESRLSREEIAGIVEQRTECLLNNGCSC